MLLWKRKGAIPRWLAGAVFLICALAMTGLLASEVTPRREQLMLEASVNGGEMTLEAGYEYGGALTLAGGDASRMGEPVASDAGSQAHG